MTIESNSDMMATDSTQAHAERTTLDWTVSVYTRQLHVTAM